MYYYVNAKNAPKTAPGRFPILPVSSNCPADKAAGSMDHSCCHSSSYYCRRQKCFRHSSTEPELLLSISRSNYRCHYYSLQINPFYTIPFSDSPCQRGYCIVCVMDCFGEYKNFLFCGLSLCFRHPYDHSRHIVSRIPALFLHCAVYYLF